MMQSLRCLAPGGRHLVVGFASGIEAEEVPMVSGRALCFGNFDVVGVILAYVDDAVPRSDLPVPVPVPRFNAPPAVGRAAGPGPPARAARRRSDPTRWSARRVPFEQLPQALEDMEARDHDRPRRHRPVRRHDPYRMVAARA